MKLSIPVMILVFACALSTTRASGQEYYGQQQQQQRQLQWDQPQETFAEDGSHHDDDQDHNGDDQNQNNHFGRGNAPDHVSQDQIDRFSTQTQIKQDGRALDYQQVSRHGNNRVNVGGRDISLADEDLIPLDIMSKGTGKILVDGQEQLFTPLLFKSKDEDSVLITKDVNGRLLSATKRGGHGDNNVDVLRLNERNDDGDDDVYATVTQDDLDEEILKKFSIMDDEQRPGRRSLRHTQPFQQPTNTDEDHQGHEQRRSLSLLDVVELDVVVDSYFCAAYGGATAATAKAQSIVATTSQNYEVWGIKIKIGTMLIYCDAGNDPIRTIFNGLGPSDICGDNNPNYLLPKFKDFVASNSATLTGDLAHLFHGFDFTGTTSIGCAYIDVLCWGQQWGNGYQVGVDEMTFSSSLMTQGKLLSHEIGHNLAAHHTSIQNTIMYPFVCSSCGFHQSSIDVFYASIANAPSGCIHQESTVPTPAPTPAPTAEESAAPTDSPVAGPACEDDPNFQLYVNGDPNPVPGCPYIAGSSYKSWICSSYWWGPYYCPYTCDDC